MSSGARAKNNNRRNTENFTAREDPAAATATAATTVKPRIARVPPSMPPDRPRRGNARYRRRLLLVAHAPMQPMHSMRARARDTPDASRHFGCALRRERSPEVRYPKRRRDAQTHAFPPTDARTSLPRLSAVLEPHLIRQKRKHESRTERDSRHECAERFTSRVRRALLRRHRVHTVRRAQTARMKKKRWEGGVRGYESNARRRRRRRHAVNMRLVSLRMARGKTRRACAYAWRDGDGSRKEERREKAARGTKAMRGIRVRARALVPARSRPPSPEPRSVPWSDVYVVHQASTPHAAPAARRRAPRAYALQRQHKTVM